MKNQWIAMEHYRMHSVEQWPDGPHKEVALAAIRSTLASLSSLHGFPASECVICQNRRKEAHVVDIDVHRAAA
ncbi:MAG: hypothetical protein JO022_01930 [Acidobacteriaceae bacterium]|nr:hypothetical protein [Acidobacteriaceae bacterium]